LYDFATNLIFNSVAERKNNTNRNRIRSGSGWILSGKRIRSAKISAHYFNETAFALYETVENYAQNRLWFCWPGEEDIVFEIRQKRIVQYKLLWTLFMFREIFSERNELNPENQFDLEVFFSPSFTRNGVTIFMRVSNCRKEMSSHALFFSCLQFGILFLGIFELWQKPLTTLKYKLESFLLL
jgi:hypothetical protein